MYKKDGMSRLNNKNFVDNKNVWKGLSAFLVGFLVVMGMIIPSIVANPGLWVWDKETVDSSGSVGFYTSVDVDSSNYPHISYYDSTTDSLNYAYKDAGGWHISVVDSPGVGEYCSLVLDGNDYPHISYYDSLHDYGDLKYAYMDTGGWHFEKVDDPGQPTGWFTSIALDSYGYPHISCLENYDNALEYYYYDGDAQAWMCEAPAVTGGFDKSDTSLDLDVSNYPYISYYDTIAKTLRCVYMDITGWHCETPDGTFDYIGKYSSLVVDGDEVHISYYDETMGDLKYAYRDNGGTWHTEFVDSEGTVGLYTSLSLDDDKYPHISYYKQTGDLEGELKYAYKDAIGWHDQTVVFPGGGYSSIAIDSIGCKHISHMDVVNYDLEYAKRLEATCDDLTITFFTPNEIPDSQLPDQFTFNPHATGHNYTYNISDYVDANWTLINSGTTATYYFNDPNASSGFEIMLNTGTTEGTATLTASYGGLKSGDDLILGVGFDYYARLIYPGWNLIGWFQDYPTDAETFGQYIPGCTVVCKFNADSQSFTTHVVGIPYNEFTIDQGMGVYIYTTYMSIWNGMD